MIINSDRNHGRPRKPPPEVGYSRDKDAYRAWDGEILHFSIRKCRKGHYYNAERFEVCPECERQEKSGMEQRSPKKRC